MEENLPWPKKGDKLFTADSNDWQNNACLNFARNDWDLYAEGYKQAGDVLVSEVIETRRSQDLLIYPIVFLYRHYLELRLKDILRLGSKLNDEEVKIMGTHNISYLWEQCRKRIESLWPEGPVEDLEAVEDCIKQFSEYDPASINFRYPVDKEGERILPNLSHINIRAFGEIINNVASLLESVSCGMSEYLDLKYEIESEYRDNY